MIDRPSQNFWQRRGRGRRADARRRALSRWRAAARFSFPARVRGAADRAAPWRAAGLRWLGLPARRRGAAINFRRAKNLSLNSCARAVASRGSLSARFCLARWRGAMAGKCAGGLESAMIGRKSPRCAARGGVLIFAEGDGSGREPGRASSLCRWRHGASVRDSRIQ